LLNDGTIPGLLAPEMGDSFDKLGSQNGMAITSAPVLTEYIRNSPDPSRFGMINLPHFEGGNKVTAPFITTIGISSDSKYPQAAWKYIYAMTLEDNPITREGLSMGLSISNAVFDHNENGLDPNLIMDHKALQNAQKQSYLKTGQWQSIMMGYGNDWLNLLTSKDDPAPKLKEMAGQIDQLLAEARNKPVETESP
jgi:multiple sugar transport system substrate-binding protein